MGGLRIELMVDTGLIGLILYYSLHIYIIKALWKPALHDKDNLALVLFIFTIISTAMDYAMVSYVQEVTIFRLMYTARYCQIINSHKNIINSHEVVICNK